MRSNAKHNAQLSISFRVRSQRIRAPQSWIDDLLVAADENLSQCAGFYLRQCQTTKRCTGIELATFLDGSVLHRQSAVEWLKIASAATQAGQKVDDLAVLPGGI